MRNSMATPVTGDSKFARLEGKSLSESKRMLKTKCSHLNSIQFSLSGKLVN